MKGTLTKRGDDTVLVLTRDMLERLAAGAGDDVQITFEGRRMIVEPALDTMSKEEFDRHAKKVIEENDALFRNLADR